MTVNEARKILGKKFRSFSDEEVTILLNQLYGMAEIVIDQAVLSGSNKTPRVIDLDQRKEQNGTD